MNDREGISRDTGCVLNYEYNREIIAYGLTHCASPIFDALASKYFARENKDA